MKMTYDKYVSKINAQSKIVPAQKLAENASKFAFRASAKAADEKKKGPSKVSLNTS